MKRSIVYSFATLFIVAGLFSATSKSATQPSKTNFQVAYDGPGIPPYCAPGSTKCTTVNGR